MFKKILSLFFKPKVTVLEAESFRDKVLELKSLFEEESRLEKGYFTGTRYRGWFSKAQSLLSAHKKMLMGRRSTPTLKSSYSSLQKLLDESNEKRKAFNDAFMAKEVETQSDFFEKGQEKPLDADQWLAVVCDEDYTLVLAGAGSGKTSVIAAKAAYLAKVKNVPEEEILLLTFGKKAAEEMQKRVREKYGLKKIKAGTIHALGKGIIGKVEGKAPMVLEDDNAPTRNTQLYLENKVIERLMKTDQGFMWRMARFFSELGLPPKTQWDFNKKEEWEAYIEDQEGFVTQSNDRVKSFEEKIIADFLFSRGIKFEYEKPYKIETATVEKSQYRPDFHLTDYDIYLEHFGINRKGEPPPYFGDVEKRDYLRSMEWKKGLHEVNGTKLICTYSYMRQEGTLTRDLEDLLTQSGVRLMDHPVQYEKLIKGTDIAPFITRVIKVFLGLYKQGGHDVGELREKIRGRLDLVSLRSKAFLEIFEPFHAAYEKELADIKMIDFGDMINRARGYVEKDYVKWGARFRYIIVDEFQDTSSGAIKLIRAIGAQNPGCKLYFVGDDWQSIYRFNGSDVSLIQKFEETFIDGRIVPLGNNYRSFRNVVELGEAFITKNPFQRKKPVRSMQGVRKKNLIVNVNKLELIEKYIRNTCEWEKIKKADVFFLGRYKADQPKYLEALSRKFKDLNISFLTIHKSKGLEAEFVFLLPPKELHFPSRVSDDPILDLVAAPRENFRHAEERRLMYVAITRAKRQVFFIRPENENRMPFFREIERMLKVKEPTYH